MAKDAPALISHPKGHHEYGVDWLVRLQRRVESARSVLVVGGGALGIRTSATSPSTPATYWTDAPRPVAEFASDIASRHPTKHVTLLHSRRKLLPKFDYDLHAEVLSSLESLGVQTILGERLDLASLEQLVPTKLGQGHDRMARTVSGREIRAELIVRDFVLLYCSDR
jgi:apoptosis-inducing factor 2